MDESTSPRGSALARARLLDLAPWATVALTDDLRVTAWSEQAAAMFGVVEADALGRPAPALLSRSDDDAPWRALLAGGAPRRIAAAGDLVVEWTARPLHDERGAPAGVVCYGRDVTVEVARLGRYGLKERLLKAIVDNLGIVVWAVDADGICKYHEGRGLETIGMRQGQLLGANMFEIFGMREFGPALAGETVHNNDEHGGVIWESWLIPVRDPSGAVIEIVGISLNINDLRRGEQELREQLRLIEQQQQMIRELSTPIIEVWDHVLTLPIIGMVDSVRAAEIMDNLLQTVTRSRARYAILDMTGVEVIDTSTASHLIGLIRAIRLLGAEGVITGIHPNIAQTIVTLGLDLSTLTVRASLREALKHCIAQMSGARVRR